MSYQDTSLWKRTLGKDDKNVEPLRESFLRGREHAKSLLKKIREDFENLTMHDITHVDSLWNVADVIIGDEYPINPLEGYVLGVAFLIHDAALSYEAVGGKDALRATIDWNDFHSNEIDEKECDFKAIRAIHAEKAASVLEKIFSPLDETSSEYIGHYGEKIGQIAASHNWDIDRVAKEIPIQINPMSGMPRGWTINAQKLACILRCADAGHIDNGRAPDSIYRTLKVNGVSREHWEYQNHLGQVCEDVEDKNKLLITTSNPFIINLEKDTEDSMNGVFGAWNVAYESIKQFDAELKKSNELLKPFDLGFPHIGVSGVESKEALSKYVRTIGWQPCSFGVHASNVKALIENLGGSKLYGEDNMLFVVLRELIQNACDAIHARRKMDKMYKDGRIIIRLKQDEGKCYLEVEDDGIGMSLNCIKDYLLDFGGSYWKSSLSKRENKGLGSSGFKSIGEFGIGFYSVFMVAKTVEVITRRCEGNIEAHRVRFPGGLTLSPILFGTTLSTLVSTIVRFELKDAAEVEFSIKYHNRVISLQQALSLIVAGLDVDVFYEYEEGENNVQNVQVHQNISSPSFDKKEWLRQLFIDGLPNHFYTIVDRLDFLKDNEGNIMGLLAIADGDYISYDNNYVKTATPSIETVCGLATSFNSIWVKKGFVGYLEGKEKNVSRNDFVLDRKTTECLQKWIIERYDADYNEIIDSEALSECYYSAFTYCGINIEEIIEGNIRTLYATFKQRGIEIGTIKGLKRIHVLLFSGGATFAGNYRIHDVFIYRNGTGEKTSVVHPSALDDVLRYIEKMPEDSCEQIICKYFNMMIAHPFTDGNGRVGRIWVNLMLDRFMGKMIDWRNVEGKVLNDMVYSKLPADELGSEVLKEESFQDACGYLEQFLTPTNIYIVEITAQKS